MKKLIKNAKLIDEQNINILINDGKIEKISEVIEEKFDEIIDANNCYILSGLNNAYFDGNLKDANRLLSQGITSVFDFANDDDVTAFLVKLGIKVFKAIGDFNGETILDENYIDYEIEKLKSMGVKAPILYAINPNLSEESNYEILIKYANKFGYLIATKASENLEDVGEIDLQYGLSPIGLLESYGFLDFKNILIDCVYADKDDVSLLANYDTTTICTRPTNNLCNGSGIAPVYSFIKNKLNLLVGGVSSNQFKELSLLKDLQSGVLNETTLINNEDVFNCINTPKKLFPEIGGLEVGKCADFLFVDDNDILNLTPLNVKMVLIDGEIKYRI